MNYSKPENVFSREDYKMAFSKVLHYIGDDDADVNAAFNGFMDALDEHMTYHSLAHVRYLDFKKRFEYSS